MKLSFHYLFTRNICNDMLKKYWFATYLDFYIYKGRWENYIYIFFNYMYRIKAKCIAKKTCKKYKK